MALVIVFNSTRISITHDAEGRVVEPGAYCVVEQGNVIDYLDAGWLQLIDEGTIYETGSSPAAIMVKQEKQRLQALKGTQVMSSQTVAKAPVKSTTKK